MFGEPEKYWHALFIEPKYLQCWRLIKTTVQLNCCTMKIDEMQTAQTLLLSITESGGIIATFD